MATLGAEHVIGKDEICVCLPGFSGGVVPGNPRYGGAGYATGAIAKIDRDESWITGPQVSDHHVYWSLKDFVDHSGVYAKAVRRATPEEIEAYNKGVRNIKDMDKSFTIRYTKEDGTSGKMDVTTFSKSEAECIVALRLGEIPTIDYVFEK